MRWMVQRVLYGEVTQERNRALPDLQPREWAVLAPLAALALFMGVASPLFTRKIEPAVNALVLRTQGPARPFTGMVSAAPGPAPRAASARP